MDEFPWDTASVTSKKLKFRMSFPESPPTPNSNNVKECASGQDYCVSTMLSTWEWDGSMTSSITRGCSFNVSSGFCVTWQYFWHFHILACYGRLQYHQWRISNNKNVWHVLISTVTVVWLHLQQSSVLVMLKAVMFVTVSKMMMGACPVIKTIRIMLTNFLAEHQNVRFMLILLVPLVQMPIT